MITDVVLDIGQVLIEIDLAPLKKFFREKGINCGETPGEIDYLTNYLQYEIGNINTEQFLQGIQKKLPTPTSADEIATAWNGIFKPISPMLALLSNLRNFTRVHLLSNTNELHWNFIKENFRLHELVDTAVTSYEVQALKPQREIYLAAMDICQLQNPSTLFLDDKEENVKGAQELGWQAFTHRNVDSTVPLLKRILPQLVSLDT